MKIFLVTFLIILLFSCQQSSTKIIDRYPNGQIKTEHTYLNKNDTSNYDYKDYYENGQLKYETTIRDNKFVGEKKIYYIAGGIERIERLYHPTPMEDEIYDCYIMNFYENGNKENEYEYINDKLSGIAIEYDSAGHKTRTAEYIDGKINGTETIYYPNGKIKSLVECRNDSAYGFRYEFSETGDTLNASTHYGQSENGIFYKKWLVNGQILTGTYGDNEKSFVIWKWYDKKRNLTKTLVDNGTPTDSSTKRFTSPD